MSSRDYQETIQLNTLYEVVIKPVISGVSEQGAVSLFINSGSVDVYGSNSSLTPTSLSQMVLPSVNTDVSGIESFFIVPNYIAITQNSGTTTDLSLSGIKIVRDLGAIS